jgi:hypothetical protein
MATTLNSVGLVCDIIAAVLLLLFWVAPQTAFKGELVVSEHDYDEVDRTKLKRMRTAANPGFGLMIIGFVLQLVSNYCS